MRLTTLDVGPSRMSQEPTVMDHATLFWYQYQPNHSEQTPKSTVPDHRSQLSHRCSPTPNAIATTDIAISDDLRLRPSRSDRDAHVAPPTYHNTHVEIWLEDVRIAEIPIRTLVRFSINAAHTFPKPQHGKIEGKDLEAHRSFAGDQSAMAAVHNISQKRYDITLPGDPWLPSAKAVLIVLDWMRINSTLRHHETPTQLVLSRLLARIDLVDIVDVFAVALSFHLRPRTSWLRPLRMEIYRRLTVAPPHCLDFKLIRECLPVDQDDCECIVGGILKRLITSYLDYRDEHVYAPQDVQQIEQYVLQDGLLRSRVGDCRCTRERRKRVEPPHVKRPNSNHDLEMSWAGRLDLGLQKLCIAHTEQARLQQADESCEFGEGKEKVSAFVIEGGNNRRRRRRRPRRKQIAVGKSKEAENTGSEQLAHM
ncbi:hypothetical protein K431DRAFT_349624 [Polychaeton citri CBS 116435]|uniref:Uncharacterized protein n=1 Tax=Polychaeton citri CBS 116435 TaxID=1314669 RepID=A0A9P4ULH3_9PEZI|nr:hypothetical protein K431DRAFT_349624 [Polychaeton citri CBS 116435]